MMIYEQLIKDGFTYLNPIYEEKKVGSGIVIDVNSLYPSVMNSVEGERIPYGIPIFFNGKYEQDDYYNLYIQRIVCRFKVKSGYLPTIQIKNSLYFSSNEYLTSSHGELVALTLSNIDLELFFKHYKVEDLEYISGWKFKSILASKVFGKYINKWTNEKIKAKKEGNGGKYVLSKLMLNSLYGKFATNPHSITKWCFLDGNGVIEYIDNDEEVRHSLYLPVAIFITAQARKKTIETSQKIKEYSLKKYKKDLYIYSDTDSIHTLLPIEEVEKICKIDKYKLGYWDHESSFSEATFIRQKTYIENIDGQLSIKCAGMPQSCIYKKNKDDPTLYYKDEDGKEHIFTIKTFRTGFTCLGNLTFKQVRGGVKLIDTIFTIKERKIIEYFKK